VLVQRPSDPALKIHRIRRVGLTISRPRRSDYPASCSPAGGPFAGLICIGQYLPLHCQSPERLVLLEYLSASMNCPSLAQSAATTPAHQAVEQQDLARLRDLLDAGHDIEDDNGDGWTLLRHAIAVEPVHADMTALLLARGADPHRPSSAGTTPLDDAETRGHWLAVEIIRAWTGQRPAP
jgi:uncharacterized protein